MKTYSDQQILCLKTIINDEMFHMGHIELFEQIENYKFIIKLSKNKCKYTLTIEMEEQLDCYAALISSSFGRIVIRRGLRSDLFPVMKYSVEKVNLNEKNLNIKIPINTKCDSPNEVKDLIMDLLKTCNDNMFAIESATIDGQEVFKIGKEFVVNHIRKELI